MRGFHPNPGFPLCISLFRIKSMITYITPQSLRNLLFSRFGVFPPVISLFTLSRSGNSLSSLAPRLIFKAYTSSTQSQVLLLLPSSFYLIPIPSWQFITFRVLRLLAPPPSWGGRAGPSDTRGHTLKQGHLNGTVIGERVQYCMQIKTQHSLATIKRACARTCVL